MVDQKSQREYFKDLTILCVEDEDGVRLSLGEFLKRRFKESYLASNGKEGLEIFQDKRPDITLTDIRMPVMDGLEMCKSIKEIDPDAQLIVASSFSDPEYLLEAINIGVESYVLKPVDSTNLTNTLYRASIRAKFRLAQQQLIESEELFRVLTENLPTGVCLLKEKFIYVNESMTRITGYSKEELMGMSMSDLAYQNHNEMAEAAKRRLEGEFFFSQYDDVKIKSKGGDNRYVQITASTVKYRDETVGMANITDMTERKWFEDELSQKKAELEKLNRELKDNLLLIEYKNRQLETQLYTDKLTGLPNRLRLVEDQKLSTDPVLILLNIDSFKEVNDFYGNDVGDYVIKEVAKRLKKIADTSPFALYRLQADEYALFCMSHLEHEMINDLLSKIYSKMEEHLFILKDQEIHIGVTSGVARDNAKTVLNRADIALKSAKKHRKPYLFYNDSMKIMKEYEQNIRWMGILKEAIERDNIIPYFQPIMDNQTGKVVKFECLARLICREGKTYTPFYFLNISKRSKLYHKITTSIISKSFKIFEGSEYEFSLNLSIDDILDPMTNKFIKELLVGYSNAGNVVFEILESEGIENYELVADFISEVKEFGCKVAIDDFGSGYSNFAHILKLDVDFIKIDSSIVREVDRDKNSQIVFQTIVDFAKRLKIKTIAEYVHSKEVLEAVKKLGVDFSQGYYISEPREGVDPTIPVIEYQDNK